MFLTQNQIEEFVENGVLVVPDVITRKEIETLNDCLKTTLLNDYNVDETNLLETGYNLSQLSSTHGAGGIIDLFYNPWRLAIATDERIFNIVSTLWESTYGRYNPKKDSKDNLFYHPFESFDFKTGFIYMNRVCYRVPDQISSQCLKSNDNININNINNIINNNDSRQQTKSQRTKTNKNISKKKKNKKQRGLQRCLAPHLDCCPLDLFGIERKKCNLKVDPNLDSHSNSNNKKANIVSNKEQMRWRPIQLFLSLTDNDEPNTGGFECVKGFHKQFHKYFKSKYNINNDIDNNSCHDDELDEINEMKNNDDAMFNQVCVGDFIRLLPKEDEKVLKSFQHIGYKKGSLILFDWRTPHANARFNKSNHVRKVIYTGFLPNVPLNAKYAKQQLECYKNKTVPPDFWGNERYSHSSNDIIVKQVDEQFEFSSLGKKLMAIEPWSDNVNNNNYCTNCIRNCNNNKMMVNNTSKNVQGSKFMNNFTPVFTF